MFFLNIYNGYNGYLKVSPIDLMTFSDWVKEYNECKFLMNPNVTNTNSFLLILSRIVA